MRLYLSSYKFGDHTDELVKLAGENKKVAVITNAVDYGDPERAAHSLKEQIIELNLLGFNAEGLDLRDYFGKRVELEEKLKGYGMVWVRGGNVFILRRAYKQSGFDEILKKRLAEDSLVYAGYSAAAVVISPTLKGAEIVDDPNIVPESYNKEVDLGGLSIIDYVVAPHHKSDHQESELVEEYIVHCKKNNIPYKPLRDGEVIIIDDKGERLLTNKS